MRQIALISLHTPTLNNYKGASALPYHLIKFKSSDINIEVWSFNINGCSLEQIERSELELGVKINIINTPQWGSIMHYPIVRLFLYKPIFCYLHLPPNVHRDIQAFLKTPVSSIWIYGEELSFLAKLFNTQSIVITTPDCEAMYYYRVLGMSKIPLSKLSLLRYNLMYHRYAKIASQYPIGSRIKYHLVGNADTHFLKNLNPKINAQFIPHPHYEVNNRDLIKIEANEPIKILIAGRYDFYMADAVDEAIEVMINLPEDVKQKYKVTFLGKGWEKSNGQLLKAGYDSEIKTFVEDYATELCLHHIQLVPISVGTGTKGKVLDAFVNGLLVIGTPLAVENIAVENGKDCVEYTASDQLIYWLIKLSQDPSLITDMASSGRKTVLTYHSREKIANEFFSLLY